VYEDVPALGGGAVKQSLAALIHPPGMRRYGQIDARQASGTD